MELEWIPTFPQQQPRPCLEQREEDSRVLLVAMPLCNGLLNRELFIERAIWEKILWLDINVILVISTV